MILEEATLRLAFGYLLAHCLRFVGKFLDVKSSDLRFHRPCQFLGLTGRPAAALACAAVHRAQSCNRSRVKKFM